MVGWKNKMLLNSYPSPARSFHIINQTWTLLRFCKSLKWFMQMWCTVAMSLAGSPWSLRYSSGSGRSFLFYHIKYTLFLNSFSWIVQNRPILNKLTDKWSRKTTIRSLFFKMNGFTTWSHKCIIVYIYVCIIMY